MRTRGRSAVPTTTASDGDDGRATARTGLGWLWFGFSGVAGQTGWARQSVTIPSGQATLRYWYRFGLVSAPYDATLTVSLDGTPVAVPRRAEPAQGGYVQRAVDVSAWADGGGHVLRFDYAKPTDGQTNAHRRRRIAGRRTRGDANSDPDADRRDAARHLDHEHRPRRDREVPVRARRVRGLRGRRDVHVLAGRRGVRRVHQPRPAHGRTGSPRLPGGREGRRRQRRRHARRGGLHGLRLRDAEGRRGPRPHQGPRDRRRSCGKARADLRAAVAADDADEVHRLQKKVHRLEKKRKAARKELKAARAAYAPCLL